MSITSDRPQWRLRILEAIYIQIGGSQEGVDFYEVAKEVSKDESTPREKLPGLLSEMRDGLGLLVTPASNLRLVSLTRPAIYLVERQVMSSRQVAAEDLATAGQRLLDLCERLDFQGWRNLTVVEGFTRALRRYTATVEPIPGDPDKDG